MYEDIRKFDYRMTKTISIVTPIRPTETIRSSLSTLATNGRLYLKKGFLWDGASGAVDTKSIMLPSAFHDSGCSMYLKGFIDGEMRKQFDVLFKTLLDAEVAKGNLSKFRAAYMYRAVRANTKIRYGY